MSAITQDFDFLMGSWKIHNRYLKGRLRGSTEWIEFEGRSEAQPLLNGLGNMDRYTAERDGKSIQGITVRLFNPRTGEWSIYWADNVRAGILQPPMVGKFHGGVGEFLGDEEVDGKKVLCRFLWSANPTPRWEQAFSADSGKTWETNWIMTFTREKQHANVQGFPVIEFRRYTIGEGERAHFAQYFETFFPDAFRQLGAMAFGQFFERQNHSHFTWIRGFENMDARVTVNDAFYGGPLWSEHGKTMNDRLIDHTNVLLLRPLTPGRGIPVLPAVDPVTEGRGAQGVVVAQIFPVKANSVDAFAEQAESSFAQYRAAGAREAGVLTTLDVPNNYPRLPVRTDGPYLVWLGILKEKDVVENTFGPLAERTSQVLRGTGLLRGEPELVILDPAPRSRLRWLPD